MSDSGPCFFGWCDQAQRLDALVASLHALVLPEDLIRVSMDIPMKDDIECRTRSMADALAMIRAHFGGSRSADIASGVKLGFTERVIAFTLMCYTEENERRTPSGPLSMHPWDKRDFIPNMVALALGQPEPRAIDAEAIVAWHMVQGDLEDLLLRLCAPDASGRVTTGGCTNGWDWSAPVDLCATYNANRDEIARDLALSWVHLHDKDKVERASGLSMEALHARVDAAPHGARVEVKGAGQLSLSRETVLKAMATPPVMLLDALEAAAVPDAAWRAAEPRAQEILERTFPLDDAIPDEPPLGWRLNVDSERHARWLADHAPFRIVRTPSGGVVLDTHPYRTLWPLWADALFALGLMS